MELQLPSLPFLAAIALILIVALKRRFDKSKDPYSNKPLPPGPWQLPIIGSLHHLSGGLPHHRLRDLALKNPSPLMLIRLGEVNTIVVSSREGAEEVMKVHDANFASRPVLIAAQIVGYNCTNIGFSPYGNYYKQLRKICTVELLSLKRVKSFGPVRAEEMGNMIRDVSAVAKEGEICNVSLTVKNLTSTIVSRAAFGKKNHNNQKFLKIAKQALQIVAGFCIVDSFPSFKYLDVLSGIRRKLEDIHRQLDVIFDDILRDHQLDRANGKVDQKDEDIVDVLLRIREEGDLELPLTLDNIKAVILDLFLGGTETSAAIIEWAMSELLRKPKELEKVQNEIRQIMKGRNKLEESDVAEFHCLKLAVKETFRLHPPGPMLVPRVAEKTCEILGYKIPAGTRVMINVYALGRDPRYWEDCESFKPERFMNNPIDFKGGNFEFLPFGAGRRSCPGMDFGLASVEFALANLLFYFDWKLPHGMKPGDLDMTETSGASATRKTELKLLVTQRVSLPDN
ncbi:hypothetical protein LUZ60_015946 [Juncus effusus]|nr:hypothetical protein LUZ60_015946 [Juncus effusus]